MGFCVILLGRALETMPILRNKQWAEIIFLSPTAACRVSLVALSLTLCPPLIFVAIPQLFLRSLFLNFQHSVPH